MHEIYPKQFQLTSDEAVKETNYLDLNLRVQQGKLVSKLFDKRASFAFSIVNFPNLSGNIPKKQSFGVFTSQLIRFARCCQFSTSSKSMV